MTTACFEVREVKGELCQRARQMVARSIRNNDPSLAEGAFYHFKSCPDCKRRLRKSFVKLNFIKAAK